jgi:hypothetical protein
LFLMFSSVRVLFPLIASHKALAPSSSKPFIERSNTFNVQLLWVVKHCLTKRKACLPLGKFFRANREKRNLIGWRHALTSSPTNHIHLLLVRAKKTPSGKLAMYNNLAGFFVLQPRYSTTDLNHDIQPRNSTTILSIVAEYRG